MTIDDAAAATPDNSAGPAPAGTPAAPGATPTDGLITLTNVMYGLHAFSALTGFLSPMFIVTGFLTGWPSIIAVIINYVKRSEVRGTYLDSHFGWQLTTFWLAFMWVIIGCLAFVTFIGIPIAFVIWFATGIWVVYRIVRGWMALNEKKAVP